MKFSVSYKGIQRFVGSLDFANAYLMERWGSVARAYEFGVKLVLLR